MTISIYKRAMNIAHQIKQYFDKFGEALQAAWAIVKLFSGRKVELTFAKSTGEVREAKAIALGSLSTIEKGYFRFVELLEDETTQWRSCRFERMILPTK